MTNFLLYALCLVIGWLARHRGLFSGVKPEVTEVVQKKIDAVIDKAVDGAVFRKLTDLEGRG